MKQCNVCLKTLSSVNFHKRSASHDSLSYQCKYCNSIYLRNWRKDHKGYDKQFQIEYSKTDKGKKQRKKSVQKWRKENPLKYSACRKVLYAIKVGKIVKPSFCSVCKTNESKIEGHHADYSKPLCVKWVCKKCHTEEHRKLREGI